MSYTTAQVQQATNFKADAYYNGVYLGMLSEGDHTYRTISNDSEFGSALTGSNGAVGVVSGGEHSEAELTLRNVNKNVIYNVLQGYFDEVTNSTNIASPYEGIIEGRSVPRVKPVFPLVIYPNFTSPIDDTVYGSNTSNPMTILLPRAIYSGDFEFMMNADTQTDITLLFKGLVDTANNNRHIRMGSGVDTDGTIS
jgi:hypothetical protein